MKLPIVLAVILLQLRIASAADIHLSGSVYDRVGNPLFGARVRLVRVGESNNSTPEGNWSVEGIGPSVDATMAWIDTLVVTWKDSVTERFPVSTYAQTNKVLVMRSVQIGPPPGRDTVAAQEARRDDLLIALLRKSQPQEPTIQVVGLDGQTKTMTREQAQEVVSSLRKGAENGKKLTKVYLIGGAIATAVGAVMVATIKEKPSLQEGVAKVILGCGIGTIVIGIVVPPIVAARLENDANKVQRQIDAMPSSSRRQYPLPGLAFQFPF